MWNASTSFCFGTAVLKDTVATGIGDFGAKMGAFKVTTQKGKKALKNSIYFESLIYASVAIINW